MTTRLIRDFKAVLVLCGKCGFAPVEVSFTSLNGVTHHRFECPNCDDPAARWEWSHVNAAKVWNEKHGRFTLAAPGASAARATTDEQLLRNVTGQPAENWFEPSNSRLHLEAEDAVKRYHNFAQTHDADDNKREMISILIALAKFSRQGMVPADDVRPLVKHLCGHLMDQDEPAWLLDIRLKHPTLFPK